MSDNTAVDIIFVCFCMQVLVLARQVSRPQAQRGKDVFIWLSVSRLVTAFNRSRAYVRVIPERVYIHVI